MNIKEKLTCKYCNQIFKEPVTLTCCGDCLCKQHINDLLSIDDTNTFSCPLCNEKTTSQNFKISKIVQAMLDVEAHKFDLNPRYETILNNFKTEIINLETILNEPENFIYEEINELKRKVDLDRERAKAEIDRLANGLIEQLETFEKQFKEEYKTKVDMKHYTSLAETCKKQLNEYEKLLSLLSSNAEERDKHSKQSEITINNLQSKIKELKRNLLSNKLITYKPTETKIQDLYGELKIKHTQNNSEFLGVIQKELKEYNGNILSLAVLPNGDLVSGGEDKTIKIWNTNDGIIKQTLTGHTSWIRDLIVIDNQCLVSASEDKTIKIWNINEGTVKRTLIGHADSLLALLMLENGDFVSGSADKTIKIWNIQNGTLKKTLTGHKGTVWSLVVLANGDLVSGSADKTIKIWEVESGLVKKRLSGHSGAVYKLALLENGDLVSGFADTTIKIWNIDNGTVKRTLTGHTEYVFTLKMLPNGDLASGSGDGTIKIWEVETGKVKKDLKVDSKINSFELLENGNLVSASQQSILIWD